jgi:Icc-related predicted phosphoesterase
MNEKGIRIVLFADTHGRYQEISIPNGDILIFAGDISRYGLLSELDEFNSFLGPLPHRHKIMIAGNHDFCFEDFPEESRKRITNAIYLQDQAVSVMDMSFYGSPWQPLFMNWAFNLPPGKPLREKWDLIPKDTDVLITHGPPYGYGDLTMLGERTGDKELLRAIMRIKPKLNLFGHIHEGYGQWKVGRTLLINASVCDDQYRPLNPPVEVTINPKRHNQGR